MGILGLLPFLEKASRPCHVAEFRGCTVVIDAYCWLHKGAFGCVEKLIKGEDTNGYVLYCLKYIKMLVSHDIHPILVFDGQHLPAKKLTEQKRGLRRSEAKQKACQLLRVGKVNEARVQMKGAIDITHSMALALIQECRKIRIDCIVAPYEADAQLAYMNINNFADFVITEDSDLLLFGCNKVLFKLDIEGNGTLVESEKIHQCMKLRADNYNFDKFRYMCILSGCDYIDRLPGVGLRKALKFVTMTADPSIYNVLLKLPSYLKLSNLVVTDTYREEFMIADATFNHQLIFDPVKRELLPLNDPKTLGTKETYCVNAGDVFDTDLAFEMALGNVDPFTHDRLDNWSPDKAGLPTSSIWSTEYHRPCKPITMASTSNAPDFSNVRVSIPLHNVEIPDYDVELETVLEVYKVMKPVPKSQETEVPKPPSTDLSPRDFIPFKSKLSKFQRTTLNYEDVLFSKFFTSKRPLSLEEPSTSNYNPLLSRISNYAKKPRLSDANENIEGDEDHAGLTREIVIITEEEQGKNRFDVSKKAFDAKTREDFESTDEEIDIQEIENDQQTTESDNFMFKKPIGIPLRFMKNKKKYLKSSKSETRKISLVSTLINSEQSNARLEEIKTSPDNDEDMPEQFEDSPDEEDIIEAMENIPDNDADITEKIKDSPDKEDIIEAMENIPDNDADITEKIKDSPDKEDIIEAMENIPDNDADITEKIKDSPDKEDIIEAMENIPDNDADITEKIKDSPDKEDIIEAMENIPDNDADITEKIKDSPDKEDIIKAMENIPDNDEDITEKIKDSPDKEDIIEAMENIPDNDEDITEEIKDSPDKEDIIKAMENIPDNDEDITEEIKDSPDKEDIIKAMENIPDNDEDITEEIKDSPDKEDIIKAMENSPDNDEDITERVEGNPDNKKDIETIENSPDSDEDSTEQMEDNPDNKKDIETIENSSDSDEDITEPIDGSPDNKEDFETIENSSDNDEDINEQIEGSRDNKEDIIEISDDSSDNDEDFTEKNEGSQDNKEHIQIIEDSPDNDEDFTEQIPSTSHIKKHIETIDSSPDNELYILERIEHSCGSNDDILRITEIIPYNKQVFIELSDDSLDDDIIEQKEDSPRNKDHPTEVINLSSDDDDDDDDDEVTEVIPEIDFDRSLSPILYEADSNFAANLLELRQRAAHAKQMNLLSMSKQMKKD